jgi:hypothetical protein
MPTRKNCGLFNDLERLMLEGELYNQLLSVGIRNGGYDSKRASAIEA